MTTWFPPASFTAARQPGPAVGLPAGQGSRDGLGSCLCCAVPAGTVHGSAPQLPCGSKREGRAEPGTRLRPSESSPNASARKKTAGPTSKAPSGARPARRSLQARLLKPENPRGHCSRPRIMSTSVRCSPAWSLTCIGTCIASREPSHFTAYSPPGLSEALR